MNQFRRNPAHLQAIQQIAGQRALRGADAVTQTVLRTLSHSGTGVEHRGLPRRSSQPGEPPVSQTGSLAASHQAIGPVRDGINVVAACGTTDIRSRFLQLGTASIAPRPYMLRSLLESQPEVLKAFAGGAP